MSRKPQILLFVVLTVATLLRLIGISFGHPLAIKSDEEIVIYNILHMLENRTFEPDTFQWPGHLFMQVGYFSVTIFSYVFLGLRPEEAISIYPEETWYPAARLVSAIFGVIAVYLAYRIGRFFNFRVGLIAAGIFALFPPYVEQSHYATVDMTLTAFVLGVILCGMHYLKSPSVTSLSFMSIVSGAAITVKYPGALTTLIIATVVVLNGLLQRSWGTAIAHGFISVFWFGFSAFLISPALFTNRHELIRSLSNESKTEHPGADGRNFLERLEFYSSSYLQSSGLIMFGLLIVGAVFLIRSQALFAAPVAFGFAYLIIVGSLALHWERWALPMFTAPLLISAVGAAVTLNWAIENRSAWQKAFVGALAVLATTSLVFSAAATSVKFLTSDTRVKALSFFQENSITSDTAYFEGYSPLQAGTLGKVFADFDSEGGMLVAKDPRKKFLVLSSHTYGRYLVEDKFFSEQEFYRLAENQFREILRLEPDLYLMDPVQDRIMNPEFKREFASDLTILVEGSVWEPVNIGRRVSALSIIASGATTGPIIRVLELTE